MKLRKIAAAVLAGTVLVTAVPDFSIVSFAEENETVAETEEIVSDDTATEETVSGETEVESSTEIGNNSETENSTETEAAPEENNILEESTEEIPAADAEPEADIAVISEELEEESTQAELKENSWRYANGQPFEAMAARAIHPDAWELVNGRYVNSNGDPIPGAKLKGIDVSEHQGKIDWEKVKADGIEFAIIRCGYGSDYTYQDDAYWEYNTSECERLGIPYGVYLYSYATDTKMAASEADHVLRLLQGKNLSYPVYYDMEDNSTVGVGNDMLGQMAQTFCDKISAAGYRVGIYANLNWFNNYLTSPVFDNLSWSKWVAQYNYQCDYAKPYDMWQCTSSGYVDGINGKVDVNFTMVATNDLLPVVVDDQNIIRYSTHQQTYGWAADVANGYQSGITGYAKRMEALKITVGDGYGDLGVRYRAHVQGIGWQDKWATTGEVVGTIGEAKRLEALQIELTGSQAANYDVYYRVHSQSYGWSQWAANGEIAGTQGYAKRLEAIQIVVQKKGTAVPTEVPGNMGSKFISVPTTVDYRTYVANQGWTPMVNNGAISGTTGCALSMEGMQVVINGSPYSGGVKYDTYMQSYRWLGEANSNQEAGMPGSGKRMEAIRISLYGEMAEHYDIYYHVHAQKFGWLGWAKNGEIAGTADYARRIEAIEIMLVEKGGAAPGDTTNAFHQAKVAYSTHVQTYGWQGKVYDGATSGTTGKYKRLEAIQITLPSQENQSEIQYQVHRQIYGWEDGWTTGGNVSGTVGEAKRLEAIRIKLSGEMEQKYDVYYRVHSQTYGWLGWAKNGESAGTEGLAKRLEGIEIVLVEKGGAAPGDTANAFVK